jgi:hypothetical protein
MPSTVKGQALISQHLIVGPETDGGLGLDIGQHKSLTQALELALVYIYIKTSSLETSVQG